MKNIREIISGNIVALRKQQGMTQLDLAKKVSYSDKAVSRWEKGEVLPDVETLQNISNALNVPLGYLFEEHEDKPVVAKKSIQNEIAFRILMVLAVWTVATIFFVYGELNFDKIYWQVFVWAIPASCVVILYLNRKKKHLLTSFIGRTVLCWSLLTSLYIQFLGLNAWMIFLIGIPIQAAIVVSYIAKKLK